jgi:hypothetical protein
MINSDSSDNKSYCAITANHRNAMKKVHGIYDKLFVVLDEDIAKRLGINDSDTWVEQIETEQGEILLRKQSIKEVEVE